MDAQGQVNVRVEEDGKVVLGKGSDSDIITASAKAYLNALNRLEYLKKNPIKKLAMTQRSRRPLPKKSCGSCRVERPFARPID